MFPDFDALVARARAARDPDDLRAGVLAARLDAEVLRDLLFEITVETQIARSRCDREPLPPAVEARLHQRLAYYLACG